ncbi:MAG TPA: EAL domain-containing response regulator [Bradyrhizobium sp.]|nr:EAL domain-containing response regulator [Bradyrhizobium sp.]
MPRENGKLIGRLLVVDDDLVQRTIIGKIGAKIGFDVVIASTFEAAAAMLEQDSFDVMTLDLSLGEHDGVELLRLVADHGLHSMPIVVISACDERVLNSTRRIAEGLKLSLTDCLIKPLSLDRLKEALFAPRGAKAAKGSEAPTHDVTRERLLAALRNDEFFIEFQPKVELATGKVVGAEALARWRAAGLGLVAPAEFIPLAEQFGLMPALTERTLSLAIAGGRRLVERYPGFGIAVNISGSLLTDLALPEKIEDILRKEGMPAHALVAEITETTAMADVDRAMDILVRLRIKNIGAAIDDFGTGYSSLAALARLPFSELKIDQSFVKGCEEDPDMTKIVEASVGLARAFNMKVVVEGVDSPESLARMRRAGCDIGQGYIFAPSMTVERTEDWIMWRNRSAIGQSVTAAVPPLRTVGGQSRDR